MYYTLVYVSREFRREAPVYTPAPAPAPVVEHRVAPVQKPAAKADYYVQSIYFDSDQDVPRADQTPNLQAALNAAQQYPNDQVKLMGNADTGTYRLCADKVVCKRVYEVERILLN